MIIPKSLALDMSAKVAPLSALAETDSESDSDGGNARAPPALPPALPLAFSWPEYNLKISVVQELLFIV
jgi:hypothetical protein